jgi:hypothetical protein
VTLVEYDDFECPYCGQAEPVVRALLANFGDLRYVWRHLPLTDVHPNAALSAEAAEAADRLRSVLAHARSALEHQQELRRLTWCATPQTRGWTSTGSARIGAAMSAPTGW